MLLYAKDKGSSVCRQMDCAEETEVDPRVFGGTVVSFTEIGSKPRFCEMERKFRDSDDQIHVLCNEADEKNMGTKSTEKTRVLDYRSLLSEFDDYVASEKLGYGVSRALSYGFEMGDMVWGKVKSHPWSPGQIYNEAFVLPSVRRMRKIGYVLVAFFGDNSYEWFDPSELIPFEPHVAEKSQQTDSSHFAKAMEEAMDEISRRSALGLTCKCRNVSNFRPTNVQGHFAVDVPDYELQAVYSSKQIQKARDSFSPVRTLSFVKRCAVAPLECDSDSIKSLQKKSAVCAFRRAAFEEFDETYEHAFRARSLYASVKAQEPFNRKPPRAPLSGSLVISETMGNPKTLKYAMEVKDSTKEDKYFPKRREEAGDMTFQFGQVQASSQLQGIIGSSARDHVLHRKSLFLQTPMKHEQTGLVSKDFISSSGDIPGKKSYVSKLSRDDDDKGQDKLEARTSLKHDATGAISRSNKGSLQPFIEGKCSVRVGIKKGSILKRLFSGKTNDENCAQKPKKKKKKKKAFSSGDAWTKKSSQLDSAKRHSDMLVVRNSKLDVMQLLSNLQALSLDPLFEYSDISSIKAARQFFLRFQSLVYLKSLPITSFTTELSKSAKTLSRSNEPSKVWKKRLSFDNQQDVPSTKKLKKTNEEAKKRQYLAPFNLVRDHYGPVPINAKPVIARPEKKRAPSTKVIEPTMLVMKFPRGTSLPSTTLLKATFGRFGPLDQSAIRVIWKTSICRVVFLYKLDAQTALRYASGSNSLFGNVNVTYFLRDVKASFASEDHEVKKAKTDEPSIEPLKQQLEEAIPVHQPNIQLKSCLKRPGHKGNGNRGTERVKFMLGGKETETQFPYSSSYVAMEFVSKNTQNMVPSTLPPILPLASQPVNYKIEPSLNQVDIAEKMMKLLTRCNDVVANVTGLLGYVPYHRI